MSAPLPTLIAGQHKVFIKSTDNLVWLCEPGTHDGFGPHHAEMEPAGKSVFDFIIGQIPGDGVFLDIGAHVGCYTLRAARKGRVIAVEANPATSARLLENLVLNKLGGMVHLLAYALWDEPAMLHLAHGTSEETRSGGMRVLPYSTGVGIDVPAVTLDSLGFDRIDVMKIDTEGADIRILKGAHDTIGRCQPVIIVEDHSYLGYYRPEEIMAECNEIARLLGYTWHQIKEFGVEALDPKGLNYWVGMPPGTGS